jgi:thymidylate synthase
MLGVDHTAEMDFHQIWWGLIWDLYKDPDYIVESRGGRMFELENVSFTLLDPTQNVVKSEARNFNHEFAEKFYQWIMAGKTDPSELFGVNANAKNFSDENAGRNTAYGPRILKQLPYILDELEKNAGTRRAIISILEPDDCILLDQETKMEFPCTESITFRIRDGKLNALVNMRSNCALKTVCYDTYNFTKLQMHVLKELNDRGMKLELGTYSVKATSYHFFDRDMDLVKAILKETSY